MNRNRHDYTSTRLNYLRNWNPINQITYYKLEKFTFINVEKAKKNGEF